MDQIKLKKELNMQYKKIAIPIIIQGMLMGLVEIFNTLIVAGVSQNSIVSMGIVLQISFIFFLFTYGTTNGVSIFISQYIGKKDYDGLNKSLSISKVITCFLIITYLIITLIFPKMLITLFTTNDDIIKMTINIFRFISIGTIARFLSFLFNDTIRGLNLAKYLLYINILQIIINVTFSPMLCYGLFNFPKLGVIGTTIIYDISNLVTLLLIIFIIKKKEPKVEILFGSIKLLDISFIKKVLKKMTPLLLMEVVWSFGIAYYSIIISWKGANYLAAAQLTGSIISLFMTFYSAMNSATSTIIGRTLGANEFDKAKVFTKWLLQYSIIIGISANLILIIFAKPIINIFNFSNTIPNSTLNIAYWVLLGRSARIGVGAIAVTIINGVLKAGGDTKVIPLIELSSILIFGLGWSYLSYKLNLHIFFIALGMSIEQICRLFFGYLRYKQYKWLMNLT